MMIKKLISAHCAQARIHSLRQSAELLNVKANGALRLWKQSEVSRRGENVKVKNWFGNSACDRLSLKRTL